jgi:XTP/dITP diphosphohydrolase
MKVVVATKNAGKVRELARLFGGIDGLELVPLEPSFPDVVEDEATFEGNARKKARQMSQALGLAALADDSGLEVDALGGAPGVRSARYAIEHDDAANNTKLLAELGDRSDRSARFRCVLVFADGAIEHAEHGVVEGTIGHALRGTGGFGYDPLFVLPDGRTMAELSAEEKSEISHRADAARKMRAWLAVAAARRTG